MRLVGLDALRGIAALLVVIAHIIDRTPLDWLLDYFSLGAFGVGLFFVISGFVIPFSLEKGQAKFWIGRAFRLLPALWVSMGLAIALGKEVESARQIFGNAFMVADSIGEKKLVGVYWTLTCELYFYAVAAALYAARGNLPWVYALMCAGFSGLSLFIPQMTFISLLFIGALLRMVILEKRDDARVSLYVAVSVFALTIPQMYFSAAVALASVIPAFLFAWNRYKGPAMVELGLISYSLYLLHLPLLNALRDLPIVLFVGFGLTLPIVLSWAVYHAVEKPFIRLGRSLFQRPVTEVV